MISYAIASSVAGFVDHSVMFSCQFLIQTVVLWLGTATLFPFAAKCLVHNFDCLVSKLFDRLFNYIENKLFVSSGYPYTAVE